MVIQMAEHISREAIEQVLCGIANGLSVGETEALKTKDIKALYKIKGAKEILNTIDNDLCFIPTADVQSVVRCKDCKHREARHYEEIGEKTYIKYECKFTKYSMSDDGFCSFGARMDSDIIVPPVDNNRNLNDEETDIYNNRLEAEAKTIDEVSLL